MAIKLRKDDHDLIEEYLNALLARFARDANLAAARSYLMHVIRMSLEADGGFRHEMAATILEIEGRFTKPFHRLSLSRPQRCTAGNGRPPRAESLTRDIARTTDTFRERGPHDNNRGALIELDEPLARARRQRREADALSAMANELRTKADAAIAAAEQARRKSA